MLSIRLSLSYWRFSFVFCLTNCAGIIAEKFVLARRDSMTGEPRHIEQAHSSNHNEPKRQGLNLIIEGFASRLKLSEGWADECLQDRL